MNISKDEWGDIWNMPVGMSQKFRSNGQINEHNCIIGGAIPTTICVKGM